MLNPNKQTPKHRLRSVILKAGLQLKDHPPEAALCISSSPRSGSTWLMELLLQIPGTAAIWEPLHVTWGVVDPNLNLGWQPFLLPKTEHPALRQELSNIMSGRKLNGWTGSKSSYKDFIRSQRLVVKFVRGNGLLPWMTSQFRFHYKPLYLVRHPFAVAASQIKSFYNGTRQLRIKIPDELVPVLLKQDQDPAWVQSIRSKGAVLVAKWCINNLFTLRRSQDVADWITLTYEDLLMDAEPQLERVFQEWGVPIPATIFDQVKRASRTTRDLITDRNGQLQKWQSFFSKDEIYQMEEVLKFFDVKCYTADSFTSLQSF